MTFVHDSGGKKEDKFKFVTSHLAKCGSIVALQVCQLILVQPIQCGRFQQTRVPTQLDDARTIALQIHHHVEFPVVGSFKNSPTYDQSVFTVLLVAHCLPLLP